MVEHTAVNRGVVGSSPTRGVNKSSVSISVCGTFLYKIRSQSFQNKILSLHPKLPINYTHNLV